MGRKSRNVTEEYLNEGYEWVIDIDIEQFFDKVNYDKLTQIMWRESGFRRFVKKCL